MKIGGTCIAYKEGVMAADTLAILDDMKVFNDIKVRKTKKYLVGISGDDVPPFEYILPWLDVLDNSLDAFRFEIMLADKKGNIIRLDQRGIKEPVSHSYWAIGSGRELAMGAMAVGASAEDACGISITYSPLVGGYVHSVAW